MQGFTIPEVRAARRLRFRSMVGAMRRLTWRALLLFLLLLGADAAWALEAPKDPLDSPSWRFMYERYLGGQRMVFDERVRVDMPDAAENPLEVPVLVSAAGLEGVQEVIVFADLNPLPKILRYLPQGAAPDIGFRFKVEQSTPVRAAMRTADGLWHVGGGWLTASGGGCTTPSRGTGLGLWQNRLGEVSGRLWQHEDMQRARFRIIHPMDTGLASGIPVFHIEYVQLSSEQGRPLGRIEMFEPVSENPVISVDLNHQGKVKLDGRDIQGNVFSAVLTP